MYVRGSQVIPPRPSSAQTRREAELPSTSTANTSMFQTSIFKGPSYLGNARELYQTPPSTFSKSLATKPVKVKSSPRNSVRDSREHFVEDNYISNLQQQIQFLEMELDLQKKLNDEQKRNLFKEARPLDETLEQLKLKFVQKEKYYTDQIEELQQRMQHNEERVTLLENQLKMKEVENLKLQETISKQEQVELQKRVDAIVPLEKTVDDFKFKLKMEQQQTAKLAQQREDDSKEMTLLREKMNRLESQCKIVEGQLSSRDYTVDSLQNELDLANKKTEQLKQQLEDEIQQRELDAKKNDSNTLQKKVEELQSIIQGMEISYKKLELEKAQIEAAKYKSDDIAASYMKKISTIQQETDKIREEIILYKSNFQKISIKNEEIQQESNNIKRENSKLLEKVQILEKQRREDLENFSTQKQEMELKLFRDKNIKDQLDQLEQTLQQKEEQVVVLSNQNLEIRKMEKMAIEKTKDYMAKYDILMKQNRMLEEQVATSNAKVESLEKHLQIQDVIKALNGLSLPNLMNQNLSVAQAIQTLVELIPQQEEQANVTKLNTNTASELTNSNNKFTTMQKSQSIQSYLHR